MLSSLPLCLALALVLLSSTADAQGWVSVGGRFLKFYAKPMTFADAAATCVKVGGLLVQDDNPEVHNHLTKTGKLTWIGATDEGHEGKWTWSNGAPIGASSHWYPREPNNCCGGQNCALINFGKPGKWDDQSCGFQKPFHCQFHRPGYQPGPHGRFLKVHTEKKTQAEAQSVCRAEGGELIKVDSKEINDWLANTKIRNIWIDATDNGHEGKWTTSDGKAAMGGFWYPREPNNCCGGQNCAVVNFGAFGKWDDQGCQLANSFACQIMY